ncbi:MAG: MBL fold metallo-hydrolase [Candidatus Helarchaeota archaeon]
MEIIDGVYSIESYGFSSNCYIIGKNEIAIIDTGASDSHARLILNTIEKLGLEKSNINRIIITHHHPDHSGGLRALLMLLVENDITVCVHESAVRYYGKISNIRIRGLKDGDILTIDGMEFLVIHTPGHTEDGICLYNKKYKILVSGDTVFSYGGIGRADLPGGSMKLLVKSIEKLLKLDVEFLLPGHMDFVTEGNKHIEKSYRFALSCLNFYGY